MNSKWGIVGRFATVPPNHVFPHFAPPVLRRFPVGDRKPPQEERMDCANSGRRSGWRVIFIRFACIIICAGNYLPSDTCQWVVTCINNPRIYLAGNPRFIRPEKRNNFTLIPRRRIVFCRYRPLPYVQSCRRHARGSHAGPYRVWLAHRISKFAHN